MTLSFTAHGSIALAVNASNSWQWWPKGPFRVFEDSEYAALAGRFDEQTVSALARNLRLWSPPLLAPATTLSPQAAFNRPDGVRRLVRDLYTTSFPSPPDLAPAVICFRSANPTRINDSIIDRFSPIGWTPDSPYIQFKVYGTDEAEDCEPCTLCGEYPCLATCAYQARRKVDAY